MCDGVKRHGAGEASRQNGQFTENSSAIAAGVTRSGTIPKGRASVLVVREASLSFAVSPSLSCDLNNSLCLPRQDTFTENEIHGLYLLLVPWYIDEEPVKAEPLIGSLASVASLASALLCLSAQTACQTGDCLCPCLCLPRSRHRYYCTANSAPTRKTSWRTTAHTTIRA